jgi:hypothetical protein
MSSVEIKIKGVKSVNRGKPRAKRGKRKSKTGLLEKTKMPEYSFRGLPYNYVSPPQPTYIDRPAPAIMQQQQPSIDYKPMVDSLTQQLALARIKEQSAEEQDIIPPRVYTPMDIQLGTPPVSGKSIDSAFGEAFASTRLPPRFVPNLGLGKRDTITIPIEGRGPATFTDEPVIFGGNKPIPEKKTAARKPTVRKSATKAKEETKEK